MSKTYSTQSPSEFQPLAKPKRVLEVDGLRCWAMTAVVAIHCGLLPFGWGGVWLFYVISGFVVTGSLVQHSGASPKNQLKGFFARRAARILPIYFAYISVGLCVAWALGDQSAGRAFASMALFYNNVAMAAGQGAYRGWPTGHLWTISVEMQFYLAYGLIFVLLPRRLVVVSLFCFLAIAPLLRWCVGSWLAERMSAEAAAYAIYSAPGLHFDAFAAGALLALHPNWADSPRKALRLLAVGLATLAAYCAAYVLINVAYHHSAGVSAFRNVISGILIGERREVFLYTSVVLTFLGLLAVSLNGGGSLGALLRLRPIVFIGEISYGAYVFHALALSIVSQLAPHPAAGAGTLGAVLHGAAVFSMAYPLSIGAAWLSYRFFEQPISRSVGRSAWMKRLGQSPALHSPAIASPIQ